MAEDLSEESLARFAAEYRAKLAPSLALRPTTMVLSPDLTAEEIVYAHRVADYFAKSDGVALLSTAHPTLRPLTPWARIKLWWRWNTPWGGLPVEKVVITIPDDDPGLRGVPLRARAVNHDGPAR